VRSYPIFRLYPVLLNTFLTSAFTSTVGAQALGTKIQADANTVSEGRLGM